MKRLTNLCEALARGFFCSAVTFFVLAVIWQEGWHAFLGVIVATLGGIIIYNLAKAKKEEKANKSEGVDLREIECNEVYVLTTQVISNHYNGSGYGPQCVTFYYLGIKKENSYYELFSGKKLIEEKDTHSAGCSSKKFNVPYITEVEKFTEYLRDKTMKTIELRLLFDFITEMNVNEIVEARSDEEDDEYE